MSDSRRKTAADLRRGPQSVALLRDYADQLEEQSKKLRMYADAIQDAGMKALPVVDGILKWKNHFPEIENYVGNIRKAMVDARID